MSTNRKQKPTSTKTSGKCGEDCLRCYRRKHCPDRQIQDPRNPKQHAEMDTLLAQRIAEFKASKGLPDNGYWLGYEPQPLADRGHEQDYGCRF